MQEIVLCGNSYPKSSRSCNREEYVSWYRQLYKREDEFYPENKQQRSNVPEPWHYSSNTPMVTMVVVVAVAVVSKLCSKS